MGERYTRLYILPEQEASTDWQSPVEIAAGVLLVDNQSSTVLAQIKYRNAAAKSIKSIVVRITSQDGSGTKIHDVVEFEYTGISAAPGDFFGDRVPIPMADNNARAFSVDVLSVDFSNGTSWSRQLQKAENTVKLTGNQLANTMRSYLNKLPFIINALLTTGLLAVDLFLLGQIFSEMSRLHLGFIECLVYYGLLDTLAYVVILLATIISIPGIEKIIIRKECDKTKRAWYRIVSVLVLLPFIGLIVYFAYQT